MTRQLSDDEITLLAFERQWWKYPGTKENEIRRQLNISPTRYYQRLLALIDDPAAELHDPVLIHRLRRLRDARKSRRMTASARDTLSRCRT